ncbi:hypothetical protein ABZP36_016976 [Zizania latifolia]
MGGTDTLFVHMTDGLFLLAPSLQVYASQVFACYEKWLASRWPESASFHTGSTRCGSRCARLQAGGLLLRTAFEAMLGLLGAVAFWPLTVYFPVTTYVAQAKVQRGSRKWVALQALNVGALIVSLLAAVGSVADMVQCLGHVPTNTKRKLLNTVATEIGRNLG